MDTWIHQMVAKRARRGVATCGLVLACIAVFLVSQHRYINNFLRGPFGVTQAELDAITDVSTAPRYFVHVAGSKAIDTGIQQVTTRKSYGVETSRSVSATYYALVVGDRFLIVKSAERMPLTVEGALTRMPASLEGHLFNTPQMQGIRPRCYPYYVDNESFRLPGYIAIACLLVLAFLLVKFGLPAWRYRRDVSSHPLVKRVAAWGDPLGIALEARREADSPRYKGGGWLVADKYLIRSTFFVFDVLRISDLLWAYKKVTKHTVYFIPTGKTYACILACYGGSAEITGKEAAADAILRFAGERSPWAIFGFSEELKRLFSKSTREFCAAVEQRKRESAGRPQPNS
jgi:hypothetical protein